MAQRRSTASLFARHRVVADTNTELAMPAVNPRRERMDDPTFPSDDARASEPHNIQAKGDISALLPQVVTLKSQFEAFKGSSEAEKEKALDDITSACDLITHHVLDITEHEQGPKRAKLFVRQAKKDFHAEVTLTIRLNKAALAEVEPLLQELKRLGDLGSSRGITIEDWAEDGCEDQFGFDGDGPSKIFDIKVTEGKTALVDQHRTPKFRAPREDQRRHLDQDVLNEQDNDPDLGPEKD